MDGSKVALGDGYVVEISSLEDDEYKDGDGARGEKTQVNWRNRVSFLAFGLSNNAIYAMILSGAIDIMGDSSLPKSTVVLVNILPSTLIKMMCPWMAEYVPYHVRVWALTAINLVALIFVGYGKDLALRLSGVGLASLCSGFGESSFLALLSHYNVDDLACWSSGTGASGLVAAFLYFVLTTCAGFTLLEACVCFTLFPLLTLVCYGWLLVRHDLVQREEDKTRDQTLSRDEKLDIIKEVLCPFMLPLMLVYFAEYLILGIMYAIEFPVSETPFSTVAAEFRFYNLCAQIGVFLSRSSLSLFRIKRTWVLSMAQTGALVLFILEGIYRFVPNYLSVCGMILGIGLFGGATYANTFANMIQAMPMINRLEFAMTIVGQSDGIGIACASALAIFIEPLLARYPK